MLPLRSGKFSHGRVCFTVFLLCLTWDPVKLEQFEPNCKQAPRVPSLTRCTRCASDEVPDADVGSVEDSLPPSTEYCLKGFYRLDVNLTEYIFDMSIITREDHLVVAQLINSEEVSSRKPLEDCRKSETPNTNPLDDKDDKQCLPSGTDKIKETCTTQLTNGLKKLTALLSTEAGKRSLPSCDDFEDYTEQNESSEEGVAEVRNDTNAEAATPMLRVLRDRKISNVSIYSSDWVVHGQRITLSQNVIGYAILPNWFSRSECLNDTIVGGLNFSTSTYPHLHLVTDAAIMKGWNSTQPGFYHETIQLNLSRTSDNEDLNRIGAEGKKLIATFTSADCRVIVDDIKFPESYAANNKTVDNEGNKLNDSDLLRGVVLLNVEQEINEVDVGGVEGETEEEVRRSCKVSSDELIRFESLFGVSPKAIVRTVLRHQTITPVYSSHSNRTLLEPSRNLSIEVVEQYANSSALPAYDYRLMQVNHRLGKKEWERVVEYGIGSSLAVSAEMGATLLDHYKKTFAIYNKQGPLLVHLHFKNRNDFSVRIEKPLDAWELQLHLRVLKWMPLHATFKAAEMNQFLSFRDPTHPILNATLREAEDSGNFAVKWQLTADSAQLAYLLQMGKDFVKTVFGKSDGAEENDGFLDLVANILTGSTKEEQRRGTKLISDKLLSMLIQAGEKILALSLTDPQAPPSVDEMLLAGWNRLWNILHFVSLVEESEEVTPAEGEFHVDFDHFINLMYWLVASVEC